MLNEKRLLHKAISERSLTEVFNRGVTDSWFDDESDRRLFIFIRQYFANYNGCPSIDAVKDSFPNFELEPVQDPVSYLLDAIVAERRKKAAISMIAEAIRIMDKDKDHEAAILELQGGLIKIEEAGFSESRDIDLIVDPEKRYDEYLSRKNTPDGILGYRTGFPTIDNTISGIQKGQLIVVAALPKTGKSTLCMQMAITQHEAGNAIMFKSFEMSNDEQAARYDAMRSKLSHHRLITGSMIEEEETRYKSSLSILSKFKSGFKLVNSGDGRTVTSIANKIQTLQPDIVYIDGVYLMVDEQTGEMNTPQALTNITRSLKNLAQKTNRPIVINTQYLSHKMKGGKATLDSIGYASSFAQDADVVMGLERLEDAGDDLRWLRIMASRNSGGAEVGLSWDWDRGIFREIDKDDISVTD